MTLKGQHEIRQGLLRLIQPKETEFDAYIGDGLGNVEVAGHDGDWYVRPIGSDLPIVVKKGAAPRVEGVRVRIGREYDDGRSKRRGRLKIKGTIDTGDVTISGVEAHGDTHLAGGSDPIYIDTIQIINGLVYATSGMSVAINAGWAVIDGQPVKWSLSALNLTSDIPVSGALYAIIRVDEDGVIDSQVGAAAASFADLTWADVPRVEAGYAPLAIARMYSGQTALSRLYASPDVIDLRFAPMSSESGDTISLDNLADVNAASPANGQALTWDSTSSKWIAATSDGSGGGDLFWYIDGALSAATEVGQVVVASKPMTISKVIIHLKDTGSASSTIIDVNIGGTSIFTTEPEIAYDDADGILIATPDTTAIAEDDVITLDIDQAATGAESLTVCLVVSSANQTSSAIKVFMARSFR